MKKSILFGVLLFGVLFSLNTQAQPITKRIPIIKQPKTKIIEGFSLLHGISSNSPSFIHESTIQKTQSEFYRNYGRDALHQDIFVDDLYIMHSPTIIDEKARQLFYRALEIYEDELPASDNFETPKIQRLKIETLQLKFLPENNTQTFIFLDITHEYYNYAA